MHLDEILAIAFDILVSIQTHTFTTNLAFAICLCRQSNVKRSRNASTEKKTILRHFIKFVTAKLIIITFILGVWGG